MKIKTLNKKCPNCGCDMWYQYPCQLKKSINKNIICRKCSCIKRTNDPIWRSKIKNILQERNKGYIGENNPFYGKNHSDETKEKLKILHNDPEFKKIYKTEEFREKMSNVTSGENNGMYGKTFYGQWLEKYGKEIADQKLKDYSEKRSILSSGENNGMYGKPAPQGSGCGWKGHYKGWFFRSLRELSYMINVIEKNNYVWKTAESKDLTINYVSYDGTLRTYRADFLINDKILVEIKPLRLHNSPSVLLKKEAAEKFCQQRNLTYILIDPGILDSLTIFKLYNEKTLIFLPIYDKKYQEKYCTNTSPE